MGTAIDKKELIDWISDLDNQAILETLQSIKNSQTRGDWWEEISATEKSGIDRGLEDSEAEKATPHSQVRDTYKKWL